MTPVEVGTASGFVGAAAVAGVFAFMRYYPAIASKFESVAPARVQTSAASPTARDIDVAVLQTEVANQKRDIENHRRETRDELRAINTKLDGTRDDLSTIAGKLDLLISTRAH